MPFHLAWLYIRIFSIVFSIVRFPIIGFFCGTDDITQSSIILFFTIKGVTSCRSMYIISRNSSRALVVACLYYYCRSQSLFIPDRCYCSNRWYYNRLVDVTFLCSFISFIFSIIRSFTIRCSLSIVLILFENLLASTYCGRQDSLISSTSIIREFPFYCEVDKSAPSIAYLILLGGYA